MNTDFKDFNDLQKQAFLDLTVLFRYADGHLDLAEDAMLERLLESMGHTTPHDRERELDAAVNRVRPHAHPPKVAQARAIQLGMQFKTRDQHRMVVETLEKIVTSDSHITTAESRMLEVLRGLFRL